MGDDCSETAEPMHRLDVDAEVWREVPKGTEGRGQVAGCEWCTSPMVDDDPLRSGEFLLVERGVDTCDDRPRVRVGGGFAGEVSSIKLGKGGVDIVEVE